MKEVVAYCRAACAKQSDPSAENSRDVPALHLRGFCHERGRRPMDWRSRKARKNNNCDRAYSAELGAVREAVCLRAFGNGIAARAVVLRGRRAHICGVARKSRCCKAHSVRRPHRRQDQPRADDEGKDYANGYHPGIFSSGARVHFLASYSAALGGEARSRTAFGFHILNSSATLSASIDLGRA